MNTDLIYSDGTVATSNGGAIVLTGGLWSGANDLIVAGDEIHVNTTGTTWVKRVVLNDVVSPYTSITPTPAWSDGTLSGKSYYIQKNSPSRQAAFTALTALNQLLARLQPVSDSIDFSGDDRVVTLNKTASADDAGVVFQTASGNKFRLGLFGSDVLKLEKWNGASWTTIIAATDAATVRSSVYAAPFDALAFNGMQLNGGHNISEQFGDTLIAGITAMTFYVTDQWLITAAGAVAVSAQRLQSGPPPGFGNFLRTTVTTPDSSLASSDVLRIAQPIEGYRSVRLGFGGAGALPISIGFWVRSTLVGTYGVSIGNAFGDRSYCSTFTIGTASAWEYKTLTIPGDVSGSWLTTTGLGLIFRVALMAGSGFQGTAGAWSGSNLLTTSAQTNFAGTTSATFDITGLAVLPGLELPSSDRASLLMRPIGEEAMLCARHWQWLRDWTGRAVNTTQANGAARFARSMRAAPSYAIVLGTNAIAEFGVADRTISGITVFNPGTEGAVLVLASTGLTSPNLVALHADGNFISANARL
jgi:hypothetical protein